MRMARVNQLPLVERLLVLCVLWGLGGWEAYFFIREYAVLFLLMVLCKFIYPLLVTILYLLIFFYWHILNQHLVIPCDKHDRFEGRPKSFIQQMLTAHQNDTCSKKAHSLISDIIRLCKFSMEIKEKEQKRKLSSMKCL